MSCERCAELERERDEALAAAKTLKRLCDQARAERDEARASAEAAQLLHIAAASQRPEDWSRTVVELQERTERAEAACAQMRAALSAWRNLTVGTGPDSVSHQMAEQRRVLDLTDAALATDTGRELFERVARYERALREVGCREENGEDVGPCREYPNVPPCCVCATLNPKSENTP